MALKVVVPSGGDLVSIRRAVAFFLDNLAKQTEARGSSCRCEAVTGRLTLIAPAAARGARQDRGRPVCHRPGPALQVSRHLCLCAAGLQARTLCVLGLPPAPQKVAPPPPPCSTLEGIGKALDPDYKFTVVATPYAQELLSIQDAKSRNTFLLEALQQQAQEVGDAAAQMPLRVARVERLMTQLESGELKLRTRVLEAERSARRSGVMQAGFLPDGDSRLARSDLPALPCSWRPCTPSSRPGSSTPASPWG